MELENYGLFPCPCCGSTADFDMIEDNGNRNFGGHFVECNNPECRLTTPLIFATGDDPKWRLQEIWNKRHSMLPLCSHPSWKPVGAEIYKCELCGAEGRELRYLAVTPNERGEPGLTK